LAVFRFEGVRVWQWEDDAELLDTPTDVRGQVSDFSYYRTTNLFELQTLNTSLLFSADRLSVGLTPNTGA
jgi:hypothetical protein